MKQLTKNVSITVIEQKIQYIFNDKDLLIRAISCKNHELVDYSKTSCKLDQGTLAYLGDGLLSYLASEYTVKADTGRVSKSTIISNARFAKWIRDKELEFCILSSHDINCPPSDHTLGTVFEAIVYAIYLDTNKNLEFIADYLEKIYFVFCIDKISNCETELNVLYNLEFDKNFEQLNFVLINTFNTRAMVIKNNPTQKYPQGKVGLCFTIVDADGEEKKFKFINTQKITVGTIEELSLKALEVLEVTR